MRISKNAREKDGVSNAVAVMATDKAKYALKDAGLMTPEVQEASGSDLVIAVEASTEDLAAQTINELEALISSDPSQGSNSSADLIGQELKVVNIGLDIFKDALVEQNVKVVQVDWEVPAKGDEKVINILKKMY